MLVDRRLFLQEGKSKYACQMVTIFKHYTVLIFVETARFVFHYFMWKDVYRTLHDKSHDCSIKSHLCIQKPLIWFLLSPDNACGKMVSGKCRFSTCCDRAVVTPDNYSVCYCRHWLKFTPTEKLGKQSIRMLQPILTKHTLTER